MESVSEHVAVDATSACDVDGDASQHRQETCMVEEDETGITDSGHDLFSPTLLPTIYEGVVVGQDISIVEYPLVDRSPDTVSTGTQTSGSGGGDYGGGDVGGQPTTAGRHLVMNGLLDLTAFLKVTYNLDWAFSKFVTIALFKEYHFRVGVLFHKQGNRKFTLMDQAQFLEFTTLVASISYALHTRGGGGDRKFAILGGVLITLKSVYGKWFVEIKDTVRGTSIVYTQAEWDSFTLILPCITRCVEHAACCEQFWIEHIDRVMRSDSVYVPPPQQVNGWEADRLHDEVVLYKKLTRDSGLVSRAVAAADDGVV